MSICVCIQQEMDDCNSSYTYKSTRCNCRQFTQQKRTKFARLQSLTQITKQEPKKSRKDTKNTQSNVMCSHLWSAVTAASTSIGDGTGPKSILRRDFPAFLSIAWISLPQRKLLQVPPPQLQADETTHGDLKAIVEEEETESCVGSANLYRIWRIVAKLVCHLSFSDMGIFRTGRFRFYIYFIG